MGYVRELVITPSLPVNALLRAFAFAVSVRCKVLTDLQKFYMKTDATCKIKSVLKEEAWASARGGQEGALVPP